VTEDELLEGGLTGLERDYRKWARAAGLAAFDLIGVDDEDAEARLDDNVDRSWGWLQAALMATLAGTLGAGGEPGEAGVRGLIRQALAMSGGVTETVPVSAVTGIGTGPLILDALAQHGGAVDGWRWVHDSPEHPFPPHEALDGAEAATIDEFAIDFDGWPGDHLGCLCILEPLVRVGADG
jgi:hypothetical protein